MLAKWYWQWQSKEKKLWKSLFQRIYGEQHDGICNSAFYQKNLKAVQFFCDCFILRTVGTGYTIKLWKQDWGIGIIKYKFEILYTFTTQKEATLQEFMQIQSVSSMFWSVLTDEANQQLVQQRNLLLQSWRSQHMGEDDAK